MTDNTKEEKEVKGVKDEKEIKEHTDEDKNKKVEVVDINAVDNDKNPQRIKGASKKFSCLYSVSGKNDGTQIVDGTLEISGNTLTCVVCLDICQIPLESSCCGCLVCKYCYETTIEKGNTINKIQCPNCRKKEIRFVENRIIGRIIDSIRVTCPVDKCEQVCETEFYRSHLIKMHQDCKDQTLLKDLLERFTIKSVPKTFDDRVKAPVHRHIINKLTNNEGFCNAKKFIKSMGNCKKIIGKEDEFYHCNGCNLWFCLNCIDKECIYHYTEYHKHALELVFLDQGWTCDGRSLPDRCRSGEPTNFSSDRKLRYRCSLCDFDLCGNCLDFYNKY